VETNEGEEISRLISGYIDIIIKKRNQLHTKVQENKSDERAVVEDFVRPQKSAKVAVVSTQAATQQAQTILPAIVGNITPAKGIKSEVGKDLENVEGQSLILKKTKEGLLSLDNFIQEMNVPLQLPPFSADPVSIQWRNDMYGLNLETLKAHTSAVLAAIGSLLQHANVQKDGMDFGKVSYQISTCFGSLGEICSAIRMLSSLDKEKSETIEAAASTTVDLTKEFFKELKPIISGHPDLSELHKSALQVSTFALDLFYSDNDLKIDDEKNNDLIKCTEYVLLAINSLTNAAGRIGSRITEKRAKQSLDQLVHAAEISSISLNVNSQVLGNYLISSMCHDQFINIASEVKYKGEDIYALCSNCPDDDLLVSLEAAVAEVEDSLVCLLDSVESVESGTNLEIINYFNEINIGSKDIEENLEKKELLFIAIKDITVNSTKLIDCMKKQVNQDDGNTKLRDDIQKISALISAVVSTTKEVIANFTDPQLKERLIGFTRQMNEKAFEISAPFLKTHVILKLCAALRSATLTSNLMISSSRQSALSNRNRESMLALTKSGKELSNILANTLKAIAGAKQSPENAYHRATLVAATRKFVLSGETLIADGNKAVPEITDNYSKTNLSILTSTLHNDIELLKKLLEEEFFYFSPQDLAAALESDVVLEYSPQNIGIAELDIAERTNKLNDAVEVAVGSLSDPGSQSLRLHLIDVVTQFHSISGILNNSVIKNHKGHSDDLVQGVKKLQGAISQLINQSIDIDPDHMQRNAQEVRAITKYIMDNLPQKRGMVEAMGNIRHLTKSLPRVDYMAPNHQRKDALNIDENYSAQSNLLSVAADLSSAAQGLVNVSKGNSIDLKNNIEELQKNYGRLIDISKGVSKEGKGEMVLLGLQNLGNECDALLGALEKELLETDTLDFGGQLFGAAKNLSHIVDGFFSLFSSVNSSAELNAKAVQKLNLATSHIKNVNAPKFECGCYESIKFRAETYLNLIEKHAKVIEFLVDSNDSTKLATECLNFASDLEKFVKEAMLGAHLLAASDPQTQLADLSLLDQEYVTETCQKIQLLVEKIVESNIASFIDTTAIFNDVGDLCGAVANIENAAPNVRSSLDNAAKELAECANALAPLINNIGLYPGDEASISRMEEPKNEFLQKLNNFEQLCKANNFAGNNAKPGKMGVQLQFPLIKDCTLAIKSARNAFEIAKSPGIQSSKNEFLENLSETKSCGHFLLQEMRKVSPGSVECSEAIKKIGESTQIVKAAHCQTVEGTLKDHSNTGNLLAFINGANNTIDILSNMIESARNGARITIPIIIEFPEKFDFVNNFFI
jgi:talin